MEAARKEFARRRRDAKTRAALAVAFSIAFHLLFACFIVFISFVHVTFPGQHEKAPPPQAVALKSLSSEQWLKNRGVKAPPVPNVPSPLAQQQKPPEPEKKAPEQTPKGQVVDTAPGNGEEDPNAKFLAESSNRVKKETHAKDQTAFYRNAMPKRTTSTPSEGAGHDNVDKAQVAGNNGLGQDDRPLRDPSKQKTAMEIPDVKPRQQIALREKNGVGGPTVENTPESAAIKGNSLRLKIQPGGESGDTDSSQGKRGQPGVATLVPSQATVDKITGAAANDSLQNVDEGDGTYLNTKEWKYASFFNRVKQSVGMHWDPNTSLRQRDPTGNIYGGRDRYTVLNVSLNERGMIKDIYVEKSCGLDFLDLEAISSFERAQPFPNPPPGLMTADSTIRFQFGFFLEMGSSPRLRLFRQQD